METNHCQQNQVIVMISKFQWPSQYSSTITSRTSCRANCWAPGWRVLARTGCPVSGGRCHELITDWVIPGDFLALTSWTKKHNPGPGSHSSSHIIHDCLFSSQTDPEDGSLLYLEQVLRALVLASHWVASLLSSQCCCARRGQQFDPSRPGSLAFWRLRVESHILLAQGK